MSEPIPWADAAMAVRYKALSDPIGNDVEILYQGTLREVVGKLHASSTKSLIGVRISLPDRGSRPFHFDGHALTALLERFLPPEAQMESPNHGRS